MTFDSINNLPMENGRENCDGSNFRFASFSNDNEDKRCVCVCVSDELILNHVC